MPSGPQMPPAGGNRPIQRPSTPSTEGAKEAAKTQKAAAPKTAEQAAGVSRKAAEKATGAASSAISPENPRLEEPVIQFTASKYSSTLESFTKKNSAKIPATELRDTLSKAAQAKKKEFQDGVNKIMQSNDSPQEKLMQISVLTFKVLGTTLKVNSEYAQAMVEKSAQSDKEYRKTVADQQKAQAQSQSMSPLEKAFKWIGIAIGVVLSGIAAFATGGAGVAGVAAIISVAATMTSTAASITGEVLQATMEKPDPTASGVIMGVEITASIVAAIASFGIRTDAVIKATTTITYRVGQALGTTNQLAQSGTQIAQAETQKEIAKFESVKITEEGTKKNITFQIDRITTLTETLNQTLQAIMKQRSGDIQSITSTISGITGRMA